MGSLSSWERVTLIGTLEVSFKANKPLKITDKWMEDDGEVVVENLMMAVPPEPSIKFLLLPGAGSNKEL